MVPIATYRDERKLLAVVAAIIVATVVMLVQLDALKAGRPSVLGVAVGTAYAGFAAATAGLRDAAGAAVRTVADAPGAAARDRDLLAETRALRAENARLRETVAAQTAAGSIAETAAGFPNAITASAVGYDPENVERSIAIDRGAEAGVALDAGVVSEDGVVGRVVAVSPFESTVLLVEDAASKVPAVVDHGRWWGIATGTGRGVTLQYVSQDARLKIGDLVVTGAGRSFPEGLPIGRIAKVARPEGALYQTAVLEPAVAFGRLSRVVVAPR